MAENHESNARNIVGKLSALLGLYLTASGAIACMVSQFSYLFITSQTSQMRLLILTTFVLILSAATAYVVWSKKPEFSSFLYQKIQQFVDNLIGVISDYISSLLFFVLLCTCFFVLEGVIIVVQYLRPWSNSSLGDDVAFVSVSKSNVLFCIYDVRIKDYRAIMGNYSPDFPSDSDNEPAIVTWNQAQLFCIALNKKDQAVLGSRERYRLPSSAEWSAALGVDSDYPWGSNPSREYALGYGNYKKDDDKIPLPPSSHPKIVGSYTPNPFGLYDMGGNVWQWCEDNEMQPWKVDQWLECISCAVEGSSSPKRILRGGSYADGYVPAWRSDAARPAAPDASNPSYGFRIVLDENVTSLP